MKKINLDNALRWISKVLLLAWTIAVVIKEWLPSLPTDWIVNTGIFLVLIKLYVIND